LRVGFVTIGQSPRRDVVEEVRPLLPPSIEIVEVGALDGYSRREVEELFGPAEGEVPYVTVLRDGIEVKVSRAKLYELVEKRLRELSERGVDLAVILCTGEFPDYDVGIPVLYLGRALMSAASAVRISGALGVLVPAAEQLQYAVDRWSKIHREVEVRAVSPYTSSIEDFEAVGRDLAGRGVRLVAMDCIGYRLKHREALRRGAGPGVLVINARSLLVKLLNELLE